MRRITLLLAAILTVCSLNAQKGNKNEKVVNIDKVNYRITYNGKMVPDTTTVRKRLRIYTLPFIVKVLTFAP